MKKGLYFEWGEHERKKVRKGKKKRGGSAVSSKGCWSTFREGGGRDRGRERYFFETPKGKKEGETGLEARGTGRIKGRGEEETRT